MKKVYNMCEDIGNFRREIKLFFFFLRKMLEMKNGTLQKNNS